MKARKLPIIYDYLSPQQSHLLNVALSDHLPHVGVRDGDTTYYTDTGPTLPSATNDKFHLPPSHHLVYFPPVIRDATTLPDGTDPLHSPGPPFTRRMWAGGEMHFRNHPATAPLTLDAARAACLERIADVAVKKPDSDSPMVFVSVERRVGRCAEGEDETCLRARLGRDDNDDGAAVREVRNIVFMKSAAPAESSAAARRPRATTPRYAGQEDFAHVVRPDARLLFRYSALTYNAHAIHLDPEYCRTVEGLPGLLVHGPLMSTILCTLLRRHLVGKEEKGGSGKFEGIRSIKYRNTHPLYCGEPIRICGKRIGEWEWATWAETPEGHLAVEGEVVTEMIDGSPWEVYEDEAVFSRRGRG